ncbi:MAG: hypothetical protein AAFP17_08720 [Pseudomonadota bacterium]
MNASGTGSWFDTRSAALDSAARRLARGDRNFDLGCFQINHRWHGDAFPSLKAMIDPQTNADYAARFLRSLHSETGDWMTAAGLYHSRTPALARAYRARVARFLGRPPERIQRALPRQDLATASGDAADPPRGLAATIEMQRTTPPGRFLAAGAGRGLIEAATRRLIVAQPSGPLIRRLPRAGKPPGPGGLLFATERRPTLVTAGVASTPPEVER